MAGQGVKQRCSLNSWCPIHVHTPMPMPSTLAGPCTQDGAPPRIYSMVSLPLGLGAEATPQLCYKDVCKHEMKVCNIDTDSWEAFADDRTLWKQQVSQGLKRGEAAFQEKNDERQARRTARHQQDHQKPYQASVFTCQGCSRDC